MGTSMNPPIAGCSTISRCHRQNRFPLRHWSAMINGSSRRMMRRCRWPCANCKLTPPLGFGLRGQYSQRATGNVVGAVFRHDTSRALDPHLHSHCILFNATWDSTEGRWKALEACEMVTAQKFVRNVYYHELVRSLQRFGYGVENNPRGDFEIAGVSKELIDRFSKRHARD